MAKPWLSKAPDGRWLAPAFVDRHSHPLFAAREAASVDLAGCTNVDDILAVLTNHLRAQPDAKWIDATPFDRTISGEFLSKTLDSVSADVPITLHSSDHHALWVNTAALQVAGLLSASESTLATSAAMLPQLSDGQIVCDAQGLPSGLLLEWSAMKLVLDLQPVPTPETDLQNLMLAQNRLLDGGVVAVSDAWIDPGMGEVYLAALERGSLIMPVELWVRVSPEAVDEQLEYLARLWRQVQRAGANHLLRVAGIKLFLDGVLSSKTAALLDSHLGDGSSHLIWQDDALNEVFGRVAALSSELRPHFHAIGDAAVSQAARVVQRAQAAGFWSGGHGAVIAHAELVSAADAPLLAQLGIEVVVSPQSLASDDEHLALRQLLPSATASRVGDFEPMLDAGVQLSYGSDWPVSPPEPLVAIAEAAKHLMKRGCPAGDALAKAWGIASGRLMNRMVLFEENPLEVFLLDTERFSSLKYALVP